MCAPGVGSLWNVMFVKKKMRQGNMGKATELKLSNSSGLSIRPPDYLDTPRFRKTKSLLFI